MRPWARLIAAYPRAGVTEATTIIYHERLQRYDIETLMAAVNIAIDRCTFFPSVAELIENIAALGAGRAGVMNERRPSKEEAKAVLASLHESIREFESKDLKAREKKIADRKAELRRQAELLGVKKK